MERTPEQCPHRGPVTWREGCEVACCELVGQTLGSKTDDPDLAARDACVACCRSTPPDASRLNPIVASLVLRAAGRIIERGGVPGCSVSHAEQARHRAILSLELTVSAPARVSPEGPSAQEGRRLADRAGTRPQAGTGKVGLIGWNTATGLGAMNRDLARYGFIDRWLVPDHSRFPTMPYPEAPCRFDFVSGHRKSVDLRSWLTGLDWVVIVEHPYYEDTLRQARRHGVRVAVVPMWELAHPRLEWMEFVDLVICPHRWAFQVFRDWKERYAAAWDVAYFPWPVDCQQFPFRQRLQCRRFLFINGTGGCRANRRETTGSPLTPCRKGAELLLDAARQLPFIPFLVYSQLPIRGPIPPNVLFRQGLPTQTQLYDEGDVCVQPSHWEGLGLQLLECQAAGLPLVTTDAPPMNEFEPYRVVPVDRTEVVSVNRFHPFQAHFMTAESLAKILAQLHGTDVAEASRNARAFVEREHSWEKAGSGLRDLLFQSYE